MGFDHPQYEMYSTSKHGIRHGMKRDGILAESAAAPACQDLDEIRAMAKEMRAHHKTAE